MTHRYALLARPKEREIPLKLYISFMLPPNVGVEEAKSFTNESFIMDYLRPKSLSLNGNRYSSGDALLEDYDRIIIDEEKNITNLDLVRKIAPDILEKYEDALNKHLASFQGVLIDAIDIHILDELESEQGIDSTVRKEKHNKECKEAILGIMMSEFYSHFNRGKIEDFIHNTIPPYDVVDHVYIPY